MFITGNMKVFVSLVLEVCLQSTNLELKHTNTSFVNTNNDKSLLFMLPLANHRNFKLPDCLLLTY